MSNPRPDPPRLVATTGSNLWHKGTPTCYEPVYLKADVDALLSDLRTLEAQWRNGRPIEFGTDLSLYAEGAEDAFLMAADDLAALLARLEGQ